MDEVKLNAENKRYNVRFLRRYLNLTQKEFINQFLCDENDKPSMSIATLSNLEAKGGPRINEVILAASESLGIDVMFFSMEPEQFAERLSLVLPNNQEVETIQQSSKKRNIDQLLNRLTMYFAEQLFDKTLKKGDKVESDRVLARKLGVGRSAVREALKVLDILGMIDIRPGQGTFISSDEANFFIVPLSWSLFLNGGQTESILEVRNVLEKKAAELAAESTQEDALQKLSEISHQIHESYVQQNYQAFLNCDIDFHICLAECSGNQIIYSMIQIISNLMRQISGTGMADENQLREIYEEHRLVYGAVLAHDAEAAGRYMEEHLHKSMLRYNYR